MRATMGTRLVFFENSRFKLRLKESNTDYVQYYSEYPEGDEIIN